MTLAVTPADYGDAVVRALVERVQAEYVERYGGPDETAMDGDEFAGSDGLFVVGWAEGVAVACGGFRRHDATTAELKRMYVVPEARGMGYARDLLAALEDGARLRGYGRVVLETGTGQPEAMALYTSSGYSPVEGFGYYRDSPLSRSYAKDL